MKCARCGNELEELFFLKKGKLICRNCLKYRVKRLEKSKYPGDGKYKLRFKLTNAQKEASDFVLKHVIDKKTCILKAVTGAGKTEIIYETISYCVKHKKKIGIVIPRKDVVIELSKRISNDFSNTTVVSFYGGSNDHVYGNIIVLTAHQLYKFPNYFDLVIIDEFDAFPFYKNCILNTFLNNSVKGSVVYMSATVPRELENKGYDIFTLKNRFHGEKLDLPKIRYFFPLLEIKKFIGRNENAINLIYFPTINLEKKFSRKIKQEHYVLNSKTANRKEILTEIHSKKSAIILTTLVLERGVTFPNSNVFVYLADHELFNEANLVQIAGRVGRSKDYPHGEIVFYVNKKTRTVKNAIKRIKNYNA